MHQLCIIDNNAYLHYNSRISRSNFDVNKGNNFLLQIGKKLLSCYPVKCFQILLSNLVVFYIGLFTENNTCGQNMHEICWK